MKVRFRKKYLKDFKKLPIHIQKRMVKQLALLLENLDHPSLHTKKMEGHIGIWEARLSKGYRFTFTVEGDTIVLRRIGPHDILHNP